MGQIAKRRVDGRDYSEVIYQVREIRAVVAHLKGEMDRNGDRISISIGPSVLYFRQSTFLGEEDQYSIIGQRDEETSLYRVLLSMLHGRY